MVGGWWICCSSMGCAPGKQRYQWENYPPMQCRHFVCLIRNTISDDGAILDSFSFLTAGIEGMKGVKGPTN